MSSPNALEPGKGVHAPVPSAPEPVRGAHSLSLVVGLICIVLIAIDLRPAIVSIGPLLPSIQPEFNLSHTTASLLTAIPDVLMGLLALPTPWLARRYGRDRVILVALVLLLVATVVRAFSDSTAQLLASTVAVGAGLAVAGALVGGFIKSAFPGKAAFVMGIYAGSLALGATISAGVTAPLAAHFGGWRIGTGMWAILGLSAIGAWLFIEHHQRQQQASRPVATKRHGLPFDDPKAWLVAIFFGANNLLFYGLVSWIAPIYREHGFDGATAGLILASFPATFVVGTTLGGVFSRKPDRRFVLAVFSAIGLVGLVATAAKPDMLPFLFIPMAAFGIGGGFSLGMTLPLDNARDADEANAWNAFVITVAYLVASGGPLLVGVLRDATGNFGAALWLLAGVGVLMLVLTVFLRPKYVQSSRS